MRLSGFFPPPDHTFLPIGEDDQFDLFESISTLFNFQIRDENFIYIISLIHGNYISALKINMRLSGFFPPPDHTFLPIGEDDQFDLFESISTLFNFQIRDENFIYIISLIHGNYISALKINLWVKRRVYRENLYTLNYAFIFFTTTSLLN